MSFRFVTKIFQREIRVGILDPHSAGIEAQLNEMGLHLYGQQQQPGMADMAAGRFMGYPLCAAAPRPILPQRRN